MWAGISPLPSQGKGHDFSYTFQTYRRIDQLRTFLRQDNKTFGFDCYFIEVLLFLSCHVDGRQCQSEEQGSRIDAPFQCDSDEQAKRAVLTSNLVTRERETAFRAFVVKSRMSTLRQWTGGCFGK